MRRAIAIAGPSGAGKTSLARALVATNPFFCTITSLTTRPARAGDQEDYIVVDESAFDRALIGGELVCVTRLGGARYGVLAERLQGALCAGQMPVCVLDPHGVSSLRALLGRERVYAVWLDPSDRAARLVGRDGTAAARRRRSVDADIRATTIDFELRVCRPEPLGALVPQVVCHALQLPLELAVPAAAGRPSCTS